MKSAKFKGLMALSATAVFMVNIHIYGRFILPSFQADFFFFFPPITPFSGIYVLYFVLAVLPGLLISANTTRPSDYIFLLLYFILYLPSVAFFAMYNADFDTAETFATLMFCVSFSAIQLKNLIPVRSFTFSQTPSRALRRSVLSLLVGVPILAALLFGEYSLESLTENVYERRRYIKEGLTDIPTFVFYICNWLGSAIAPILTVIGMARKKPALVIIGVMAGILSFAISTHKINALTAIITGLFYFFLRKKGGNEASPKAAILFVCLFIYFIPWLFSMVSGNILVLWTTTFRMALNNGFLAATYIELFSELPMVFYADSFLSSFLNSPLSQPISRIAGGYVSTVEDNNANASFLANGFANMGTAGMLFASIQCMIVMWLYDIAAARKDPMVVTALTISPALVLANTAVHTSLTSNGILLLIVMIWMMPLGGSTKRKSSKPQQPIATLDLSPSSHG
ncbi:hypothetical protein [Roseovarius sp. E0-M6]|uniref:hypothetical protein n=1 Tax=Roseovarius sp. E0-M6 TaxID=3127118 RepID=UPI00300FC32C